MRESSTCYDLDDKSRATEIILNGFSILNFNPRSLKNKRDCLWKSVCVGVCSGMNDVRKASVMCDLYMVTKTVIEEACVRAERERIWKRCEV